MKKMVFTKTHLFFIRITGDIVSIWILITYLSVLKYRIEIWKWMLLLFNMKTKLGVDMSPHGFGQWKGVFYCKKGCFPVLKLDRLLTNQIWCLALEERLFASGRSDRALCAFPSSWGFKTVRQGVWQVSRLCNSSTGCQRSGQGVWQSNRVSEIRMGRCLTVGHLKRLPAGTSFWPHGWLLPSSQLKLSPTPCFRLRIHLNFQ